MSTDKTHDLSPYQEFISWMKLSVLPLWHSCGFDDDSGAAFDSLQLKDNGFIDTCAGKLLTERLLQNQAKQIFVFSRAECIGWGGIYQCAVKRIFEFVARQGTSQCRSDGYVYSLDRQFNVLDDRYDLVDHGYFLLACAAAHTAFGGGSDVRRANNIMEWLDLHFAHEMGGWKESSVTTPRRRLATLGVMFEAFITLYEVTNKDAWFDKATRCYELFYRYHWCEVQHLAYSECNDHWQVANPEVILEDQFQWVWLLLRYSKCGEAPAALMAFQLYDAASKAINVATAISPLGEGESLNSANALAEGAEAKCVVNNKVTCDARILKASVLMAMSEKVSAVSVDMGAALGALLRIRAMAVADENGFFSASNFQLKETCTVEVFYEVFQAALQIKTYLDNS